MSKVPKITPLSVRNQAASPQDTPAYQYPYTSNPVVPSYQPPAPHHPVPSYNQQSVPLNEDYHRPAYSQTSFDQRAISRLPSASYTGMSNPASYCYINSVLQCLARTQGFGETFRQWPSVEFQLNPASKFRGKLAWEVHQLVQALTGGARLAEARGVVTALGAPVFNGYTQQDAHEFLRVLLDALNEETSALVTEHFQGMLHTQAYCLHCGTLATARDNFLDLSLPLPSSPRVSLYDCFDLFTQTTETPDFVCESCGKAGGRVNTKLISSPHLLVLHLKRFLSMAGRSAKLHTPVNIPSELSLDRYGSQGRYRLTATVHHSGEAGGGHYRAYCIHRNCLEGDIWAVFDDSRAGPGQLPMETAYLLFYTLIV